MIADDLTGGNATGVLLHKMRLLTTKRPDAAGVSLNTEIVLLVAYGLLVDGGKNGM